MTYQRLARFGWLFVVLSVMVAAIQIARDAWSWTTFVSLVLNVATVALLLVVRRREPKRLDW